MKRVEILIFLWVVIASLCAYLPLEWFYLLIIYLLTLVGSSWAYIKALLFFKDQQSYSWFLVIAMGALITAVIIHGTHSSYGLAFIAVFLFVRSIAVSWSNYTINKKAILNIDPEISQVAFDKMENRLEQLFEKIEEIDQRSSTSTDIQALVEVMDEFIARLHKERPALHNEKTLHDNEIRKTLLAAFSKAQKEIDIISPWINAYAVDQTFIKIMQQALKRGVTIKILYGIDGSGSRNTDDRDPRSQDMAEKLQRHFKIYYPYFKVKYGNTHEKLLLCDDSFFMIGSYNLLSFKGEYDSKTRKEVMFYSENSDIIRKLRKKYFAF